jgi:hypothetical protein
VEWFIIIATRAVIEDWITDHPFELKFALLILEVHDRVTSGCWTKSSKEATDNSETCTARAALMTSMLFFGESQGGSTTESKPILEFFGSAM